MSSQFFPKLSQNYIELLEDDEYYDLTIEVGEDPNVKILRSHRNILCCRSPYLRRALDLNNKKDDSILAHIKLPNISPETFQIILKYIYGGILSVNEHDASDILRIMVSADELLLQELVDYLQKYLIENKSDWIEQHFELIHQTSFQSNSLLELQQFCTDLMVKSPEKIFKSLDFTSLPEKSLVQLVKRDDLQMKEIEVWKYVLKWGLAQNPTFLNNKTWLDDDDKVKTMRNTLQNCLSFIRFFSLSSKEFLDEVKPYKKLLKHKLHNELLNSYMDPYIEPNDNIPLPRNIKTNIIIDSKIINLNIASTISRWIDKTDVNRKFSHLRELYLPYKFELLLRGSRDGFTPKKFHTLCDNKPITVSFIRVKGTEEILGGYNPLEWNSYNTHGKTKDSFIFSFKNKNNPFKDAIISNVKDVDHAICFFKNDGPKFGSDFGIFSSNESKDYDIIHCKKSRYEKKIRDTEDSFSIEDYEVFQLVMRQNIVYTLF